MCSRLVRKGSREERRGRGEAGSEEGGGKETYGERASEAEGSDDFGVAEAVGDPAYPDLA